MNVTIRKAKTTDAELISAFGEKTFRESFDSFNTPENMKRYVESSFTTAKIEEELAHPHTEFLLAFVDGQIAGYVKAISNKNNTALAEQPGFEIERIYIDQPYKGKNLAKQLLDECFNRAKEEKAKVVWLGVWEHNPRAIAFYTKWGFEKFGEHVFMLGDDPQIDWLMKKVIA